MNNKKEISQIEFANLIKILKERFQNNLRRHRGISWSKVETKLEINSCKLFSLYEMEQTGGEPDIIAYDANTGKYIFCDCSIESPTGRRNVCYDYEAQKSRKDNKAANNAVDMAENMGIELLTEGQYRKLQKLGNFDTRTSSWLYTPENIRKPGGALFADYRYGNVFIYHNPARAYYSSRGFRGLLRI